MTAVMQILRMMNVPFETVNVLEDELLRSGMKEYSQWPTFPQLYVAGEFMGGCDIMIGVLLQPLLLCTALATSGCDLYAWLLLYCYECQLNRHHQHSHCLSWKKCQTPCIL